MDNDFLSLSEDEVEEFSSLESSKVALLLSMPIPGGMEIGQQDDAPFLEVEGEGVTATLTKQEMLKLYNISQHVVHLRAEVKAKEEKLKQLK